MPRDITITVYTLAELKAAADDPASPVTAKSVERAHEWLRQGLDLFQWWDHLIKDGDGLWVPALEQIGFGEPDISFRGFWNQGDGASFTCERIDVAKLAAFLADPPEPSESIGYDGKDEDFRAWIVRKCGGVRSNPKFRRLARVAGHVSAEVRRGRNSGNYVHEYTCEFVAEMPYRDAPRVDALLAEFADAAEQLRLDLSRAIYESLREEYEYLSGEEALADAAEANEYTFDADGRREG